MVMFAIVNVLMDSSLHAYLINPSKSCYIILLLDDMRIDHMIINMNYQVKFYILL